MDQLASCIDQSNIFEFIFEAKGRQSAYDVCVRHRMQQNPEGALVEYNLNVVSFHDQVKITLGEIKSRFSDTLYQGILSRVNMPSRR
jgi:hypothetical protein